MTITIKELYDWAKRNGYENFNLCCTVINTEDDDIADVGWAGRCSDTIDDAVKVDLKNKDLLLQIYIRF